MSTSVDQAFTKEYEGEVFVEYQRMGSHMRGTVRTQNNVRGASCIFQKVGKGTASTKTRHGDVPLMNVDHTPVECFLTDYYAGDLVDKLDELKTNIPERQILARAGAYALGRKTDELIYGAVKNQAVAFGNATTTMTKANAMRIPTLFKVNDVPDDGERHVFVGPYQWEGLMALDVFVNSDYVGDHPLKNAGFDVRFWNGIWWHNFTGLESIVTDAVRCVGWHKTAVGHGIGSEVKTDITWEGLKAAHFVNNMMSQGACLIDSSGVITFDMDDNASGVS